MVEDIGFSLKNCLSLQYVGWKYFYSLGTEEDEPIYIYKAKHMRNFLRQSIKGGRVCAFIQHYKSKLCEDIFLKKNQRIKC